MTTARPKFLVLNTSTRDHARKVRCYFHKMKREQVWGRQKGAGRNSSVSVRMKSSSDINSFSGLNVQVEETLRLGKEAREEEDSRLSNEEGDDCGLAEKMTVIKIQTSRSIGMSSFRKL